MTEKHQWLDFLRTQGALIDHESITGFEDAGNGVTDLRNHTLLAPLDDHAVISVSGEDGKDFLQNQFSNDVRLVSDSHSQLAAYCSPKGRVLTLFRVIKQADRYFLLLPRERLQATLNRLKMFVLRSKVVLEDVTGRWGVLGMAGRDALTAVNRLVSNPPSYVDDCALADSLSVIRMPGNPSRFLLFAPYEVLEQAWRKCAEYVRPVTATAWDYWNIQSGVPEVLEANSDEFVPQMLNLHSLNAINFKKGCYPGQEVVARMHYLGKQKRRMYLTHIDSTEPPRPGDNLYSEPDGGGQSVGRIVTVAADPKGGFDALAVMQIATVENGEPVLTAQNAKIIFKELPYLVEVEGKR